MKLYDINIQKLPAHRNLNKLGTLSVLEFSTLTFDPKRLLYVIGTPKDEQRGNHAHYINCQIVLCLQGQIDVTLWDGCRTIVFNLFPYDYVYVPPLIWDIQTYKTGNDIMMSIHSEPFNEKDHIINKELFMQLTEKNCPNNPLNKRKKCCCKRHQQCGVSYEN